MRNYNTPKQNKEDTITSLTELQDSIKHTFTQLLRKNIYENGLNQGEIEQRKYLKKTLRHAIRTCNAGDKNVKILIKDYIKDMLIKKYNVTHCNIDTFICFSDPNQLTVQDKFDIILYLFKKEYNDLALEQIIKEYDLDQVKGRIPSEYHFEISEEDINQVFENILWISLTFNDKLAILAQRIYQNYKGNSVIDEIKDMRIDGVSAGVSGIPEGFEVDSITHITGTPASYDSVWIFYRGKSIHLSFLSFGSNKELIRVCKGIYRYNNPEQLSEVKGYTVNEMKDGSRVAVARPPFSESWVLFIRKFDTVLKDDITNIITDMNQELPINLIKWLIKGCQVIAITGEQGSGKTTLLMSLIQFIDPSCNLRIQELSFELHLRKLYPKRNIVSFRETHTISGQDGLNFQKKTEGTVNILGEVASAPVSNWLIQMASVGSLFTMFTHHAKTTKDLILSMRNALLLEGGFHNERIATEQVVESIRFDIHMKKLKDGHRYIERITEIISGKQSVFDKIYRNNCDLTKELFDTRDIVTWDNGKYIYTNPLSRQSIAMISSCLDNDEKDIFMKELEGWRNYS